MLYPPGGPDPLFDGLPMFVVIIPFGPSIIASERWRLRWIAFHASAGAAVSLAISSIGFIAHASHAWPRPSTEKVVVNTIPILIAGVFGAIA